MPRYQHNVEIDCETSEVKLIKALLDKYAFKGTGIRQLDDTFNNFNFITTPAIKKLIIKK